MLIPIEEGLKKWIDVRCRYLTSIPFFMGVSPKIQSNNIVSDFSVILNHNHADNFEVIIDSNDDVIIVLIQRDQTALRLLSENTIFLT